MADFFSDTNDVLGGAAGGAMTIGSMTGYNPYAMIAGAVVGGVAGIFNAKGKSKQKQAQAEMNIQSIDANIRQVQFQNEQLQDYLDQYDTYYDLQMASLGAQGKQSYNALTNQASDILVSNASRGHVGGSSAIMAEQAEDEIRDAFGDDMSMAGTDGLYGEQVAYMQHNLEQDRMYTQKTIGLNNETVNDLLSQRNYEQKQKKKARKKIFGIF